MNLSPHFSFNELTNTSHTTLLDKNRESAKAYIKQLKYTAGALEEVRELLGVPMTITSGYRMPQLNKAVGGSATSKHTQGLCADFIPIGMSVTEAFAKIMTHKSTLLSVRKVIIEGVKGKNWIHLQSRTPQDAKEPMELFATKDGRTYTKLS